MSDERILEVKQGRPTDDGKAVEIVIRTATGLATMQVSSQALVALGGLCLHAATNAPIGETDAIAVTEFRHQPGSAASQVIGFRTPMGHDLWFSLEGTALAALLEFLLI